MLRTIKIHPSVIGRRFQQQFSNRSYEPSFTRPVRATADNLESLPILLKHFKKTKRRRDVDDPTHPSKITFLEIKDFLNTYSKAKKVSIEPEQTNNPPELIHAFLPRGRRDQDDIIIENVEVRDIAYSGEGIAIIPRSSYAEGIISNHNDIEGKYTILLIPRTVVGDIVDVKIRMHHEHYAEGEPVKIHESKLSQRDDSLIKCEYFGKCNGCAFQMLRYEDQLIHKQHMIQRAYKFFYPEVFQSLSNMDEFGKVVASPKEYGYRTKINPHAAFYRDGTAAIGFQQAYSSRNVDVEQCPIASDTINKLYKIVRWEIQDNIGWFSRKGRTTKNLMIRDTITPKLKIKAIDEMKARVRVQIEGLFYEFDSSSFFQINHSILPRVLDYIRGHMRSSPNKIEKLVDTYCGVGFLGIALSRDLPPGAKVYGIETSAKSIEDAIDNVVLNNLDLNKFDFIEGDASQIFEVRQFKNGQVTGKNSMVIMNPSRVGSNEAYLEGLLKFNPDLIVYISCSVFTQARDLATFEKLQKKAGNVQYRVKDVVGFDFFPQTKHVESVAILERIK
ncbi:uncharacterized protein J8A68_002924 [[Candida] subhashii]|uniref:TRAM domain-containing protein n=1 Tax=[Candida] subhashii TaxID=561895 RepID=A0A8J5QNB0_9ASCO|nr:uncharacterized protein J8A68_002924 [[Candida] subhashii]KAG7663540.1 hypothetical protein J8A68_002924 [[Candida] subhashii]